MLNNITLLIWPSDFGGSSGKTASKDLQTSKPTNKEWRKVLKKYCG